MDFIYKKEIIVDILDAIDCINYTQIFKEILKKYSLSQNYFDLYIDYCINNNYMNKIYVEDNTVGGSNEKIFTGYKLTHLGKNYIRNN